MDEHSIALRVCVNSTVIGDALQRRAYVKSPEDREWVSIIETVLGTGGFIRPLLQTIFKPETRPDTGTWRLLILDGYSSYTAIDFLWFCKQQQIYLLFLPAHTSHVLQPLDLGVFAPLKSRYRSQIAALASLDDASPIKKQRFLTCYNSAR
ncbi:hypothetical protein E4T42_09759 [Aureobasidium subglaciale]|nr:hypothetical protein E4T42_09759 [Aureobasidium subglaciale]